VNFKQEERLFKLDKPTIAECVGVVKDNGGSPITDIGVCWNKSGESFYCHTFLFRGEAQATQTGVNTELNRTGWEPNRLPVNLYLRR